MPLPPIDPIIKAALCARPNTPEAELLQVIAWHIEIDAELKRQRPHPTCPSMDEQWAADAFTRYASHAEAYGSIQEIQKFFEQRNQDILLIREDPFHHGWLAPKADDLHWEVMRLRLANPGIPITVNVWGSNGSGKSVLCAAIIAQCAVNSRPIDSSRMVIWCFGLNQKNSQEIQQANIYEQFPREYRDPTGKPFKRNANAGMTFSAGKFTDNEAKLPHGTKLEWRFFGDNSDLKRGMEGPRPFVVWSDEEIAQPWIEGIENRLITMAGKTDLYLHKWRKMLEEKKANPALQVPRSVWHELYCGVHLISYTCKGGYTPAVRAVSNGATIVRSIDAELLPLKDDNGKVTGYEKVPELIRSANGKTIAMRFFAWENPWGGNWEGMKRSLEGASREKILWMAYGVAEGTTNVVFSQFNRAAHVLPLSRLPKEGTWYHIADPTDAKRNWFMLWIKISSQQISFIAREWPQPDDHIPSIGKLGAWAVTSTGKKFDGDRGPAQKKVIFGYSGIAAEIERVEQEIEDLEMKLHGRSDIKERRRVERIMDAAFANTETMGHSSSETHIEAMEKHGYYFRPSGTGGGGESNARSIRHRSQFVADLLDYDKHQVDLNEELGIYNFHGKAPLMRVAASCQNTIDAFEMWTNEDGGEGACKDPMDCAGYYATCRPEYLAPNTQGFHGGEYF